MDLGRLLLHPTSVAIVGASDDPSSPSGRPLVALDGIGFGGTVFPVSRSREVVQGRRAWPRLGDLPVVPEHALVVTGTAAVQGIVEEACELGVPLVTVLADGYGEAGADGEERVRRLRDSLRGSCTRLVGPSSLGVVSLLGKVALTANPIFCGNPPARGTTFVASQSGSMMGALASHAVARGVGLAGLVSVGGELDLSLGEICTATVDDPAIDSFVLFLETTRHGDHLETFARRAADLGKPVVAHLLGRSSQGAALAKTHTGALAGDHAVSSAFLKGLGIATVENVSSLVDSIGLARLLPVRRARSTLRVGVVSTTGGGAATLVDQLGHRGLQVTPPSGTVLARLADGGVVVAAASIVDLTLAGTRPEFIRHAVGTLADSGELDLVVTVIGSSAVTAPELTVHPLAEIGSRHGVPVVALLIPHAPAAFEHLRDAGTPVFTSPENCADAILALSRRRAPAATRPARSASPGDIGEALDEAAAFRFVDELGIRRVPAVDLDLPVTEPLDLPFPYPVAVKILSNEVLHKTDVGGVVLDVDGPAELVAAAERVATGVAARQPGFRPARVVVEPMIRGVVELLVGYRADADAGPVVLVGLGGELAEAMKDRCLRLAPVDADEAREMLEELNAFVLLTGFRGRPVADLDAVAEAVAAFSRLAERPEVVEAELNPLVVGAVGAGVTAVDALFIVRSEAT